MLIHPQFDPVALSLGPIAIRWYGLMYLIAFLGFFLLGRWRLRRPPFAQASGRGFSTQVLWLRVGLANRGPDELVRAITWDFPVIGRLDFHLVHEDGRVDGAPLASSAKIVVNSTPSLASASITPDPAFRNTALTCAPGSANTTRAPCATA